MIQERPDGKIEFQFKNGKTDILDSKDFSGTILYLVKKIVELDYRVATLEGK